jgi:hypothetical protein
MWSYMRLKPLRPHGESKLLSDRSTPWEGLEVGGGTLCVLFCEEFRARCSHTCASVLVDP